MSQSKTYFHHEAINGCNSLDEYSNKIKDCGDSTTGFIPLLNKIKGMKTVIIKKNKKEIDNCISWCDEQYKIDSKELVNDMSDQLNLIKGLVINQSEINEKLKDIWTYLVDDEWLDSYSDLTKINIQVQSHNIDETAARALHESI